MWGYVDCAAPPHAGDGFEAFEAAADYGKHAFSVIEVDLRLLEPLIRTK